MTRDASGAHVETVLKRPYPGRPEDIFSRGDKMRALKAPVSRLAAMPAPVLIRGESGVGKELVAWAIHRMSDRASQPFVKVGCASLPADLLESDLFGDDNPAGGKVHAAEGGTLFLDEIGEASMTAQGRLSRVLDDCRGSIRVLAATSADMYRLVASGRFRGDLYERLSVATIDVPPLRERRDEIAPLVQHFFEQFGREFQRPVPRMSEAMTALLRAYDWPGNVRELENIVKRWVVLGTEDKVREEIEARRAAAGRAAAGGGRTLGLRDIARQAAREAERQALQDALERSHGNRAAAARQLRVSYKTLLQKLAETGLATPRQAQPKREPRE
jgi:two-component system response regulator AtoC